MKTKGWLIGFMALAVFVTVYIIKTTNQKNLGTDTTPVKIGCIYPLTGNGAQYGEYFRMGTELAYTYALRNDLITRENIEFLYEDGKGLATESITALNKLIVTDSISGCLSDLSSVLVPIKPLVNKNNIPTINSSSFSSSIEDGDDFMFSILPNADSYAKQIAEHAFNYLNKRNAAIVYRNDDMGTSFNKVFTEVFESLGGKIVIREGHEKGEIDYRVIAQKLKKESRTDVVFCASYGVEVARLLKQLTEVNYSNEYITFQGFIIPDVFEIAGQATEGVHVLGSGFTTSSTEMVTEVSQLAAEMFGTDELNFYTAAHFDAAMIFIKAVAAGNRTGPDIRNYLDSESFNHKGITGDLVFNTNGLVDLKLTPFIVKKGEFVSNVK